MRGGGHAIVVAGERGLDGLAIGVGERRAKVVERFDYARDLRRERLKLDGDGDGARLDAHPHDGHGAEGGEHAESRDRCQATPHGRDSTARGSEVSGSES